LNPINYHPDAQIRAAQNAADALRVRLVILEASTPGEIEAAFTRLKKQRIDALATDSSAVFTFEGAQLATLAARHAVPAIYPVRSTVEAGGLMSYGGNFTDAFRLVGTYAGHT
jgi:putative tryptophan/tyrosine transport system substrate-binding protein